MLDRHLRGFYYFREEVLRSGSTCSENANLPLPTTPRSRAPV